VKRALVYNHSASPSITTATVGSPTPGILFSVTNGKVEKVGDHNSTLMHPLWHGVCDSHAFCPPRNDGCETTRTAYCRYTFLCGYGPYSWEVRCRFSEVVALHDRIDREAAACGIPGPTRRYTLLPQVKGSDAVGPTPPVVFPPPSDPGRLIPAAILPHHIFRHAAAIHHPSASPSSISLTLPCAYFLPSCPSQRHETRPEFLVQRHREVIGYLQAVVGAEKLWALQPVRAFFEVRQLCAHGTDLPSKPTARTRARRHKHCEKERERTCLDSLHSCAAPCWRVHQSSRAGAHDRIQCLHSSGQCHHLSGQCCHLIGSMPLIKGGRAELRSGPWQERQGGLGLGQQWGAPWGRVHGFSSALARAPGRLRRVVRGQHLRPAAVSGGRNRSTPAAPTHRHKAAPLKSLLKVLVGEASLPGRGAASRGALLRVDGRPRSSHSFTVCSA